jgi:SAM-dependent methyltransferase
MVPRFLTWLIVLCFTGLIPLLMGQPAVGGKPAPGSKEQWNENFKDPAIRRTEPDDLLIRATTGRSMGSALDLGMGQGRNTLYLAEKGWRATGVDFSEVAVADAKMEAVKRGLQIDAIGADLDTYELGKERWDLILYSYMQSWLKTSKLDHPMRIRTALRPGGLVVIEGYAGPDAPTGASFETNELPRTFGNLKILFYEDTVAVPKWGRQRVPRRVVRFIAQRE